MAFGFPNTNLPFLDNVSMFLIGHLSLLLPLVCLLLMFDFLPGVHSCRPHTTFVRIPAHQDRPFLNRWSLNINQLSWNPSSLQNCIPQDFSKQGPEQAKFCFPEAQGFNTAFCCWSLPSGSWTLYHLMVTAAKAAPTFIYLISFPYF